MSRAERFWFLQPEISTMNWFEKLPGETKIVGETIELGGSQGAEGTCPESETLVVLGASSLDSRL